MNTAFIFIVVKWGESSTLWSGQYLFEGLENVGAGHRHNDVYLVDDKQGLVLSLVGEEG